MSDKQLVLAIFKDEAAADAAVESLKQWDKADDDLKLNAIGVLVLDDKGEVAPAVEAAEAAAPDEA
jgi:hypothetical protein